jgi:hypothetical protein
VNGYTGPLVYGGNSRGADRPLAGRAAGNAPSVWKGPTRTQTDLREEASRLIEARDPEASLTAAALYLQEADRIFAEAARQFSEALHERQELQVRARELDETLDILLMRRVALEALESKLMAQNEALESRVASLRAREGEVMAQKEALESEQKRIRRRAIEAAPPPMFPDSGPLHLRPNPRMALTSDDFMRSLRTLRGWAGNRSLRQISEQSGHRISSSGVRNVLNASTLPDRLEIVDAIVMGCGGTEEDRAAFASAWRRLYMGSTDSTVTDMDPVPHEFE